MKGGGESAVHIRAKDKTRNTTIYRWPVVAIFSCVVSGCGNAGKAPTVTVTTAKQQPVAGVWKATDVSVGTDIQDIDCLITESFDFSCRLHEKNLEFDAAIRGSLQVNGGQVSGSGTYYSAPRRTLADGTTVASLTISGGMVSEASRLDLTINAAGISFSPSLDYDVVLHNKPSTLAAVHGPYSEFDIFGDPASFAVDLNGAITTQSSTGCIGNGQVSIIQGEFNVYDIALDVSSCGSLDGSYTGLGTIGTRVIRDNEEFDNPTENDVFSFNIFTNQIVIDGAAVK